jgi:hypothetical protein
MLKQKLNQIKVILGLEVKLAADKLIDGTSIEAEEFSPGFPLFILAEDGTKSPAPAGEHETESGLKLEVDAEGKIISAETKAEETADVDETEVAVAAAAEDMVPASVTPEEEAKKQASVNEALTKMIMAVEEIATDVANIKKDVTETKAEMASMKSKYEKFSKTPGAAKAPSVTGGEFEAFSALDAKVAALQALKNDNFFTK